MQLLCQFETSDRAEWAVDFDAHAEDRGAAGLTQMQIWYDADNPTRVVVLFDVHDRAKASAWVKAEAALASVTAQFLKTA